MNLSTTQLFRAARINGYSEFGADMDDSLIARYQPGGDIYSSLIGTRGSEAADRMAAAASTGSRANVTTTMGVISTGPNTGSTSVLGNFFKQITTDPLRAPVAAALGQGSSGPGLGKNTTGNIVKGAATLGIIALGLYAWSTYKKGK